ncbi:DUF397 domain-containing protein [Streptomyces sp. JJ66]|uniref:DUF397 domain-containing protein n=1 Tax=Streptomyces sp. JJ66 TaxID=2803843 RepID=UPI001C565006|nr:DUF397 domain-containing protein [Streptomyces sp. JJ66]MBW1604402.1 DUF397 domain-containing protein [Streptomyces sp. JJ66]
MRMYDQHSELHWHTSSYSGGSGGNCVEVADGAPGFVPVRDSKAPTGPVLTFPAAGWTAFVTALQPATAPRWRKSSHSGGSGGDCVEVADNLPGIVPVRDSKASHRPALRFPGPSWASFISAVRTKTITHPH